VPQPDGTTAYAPRSAEELQQLAALVRSAAGVDESRGDVVEVVSRPFAANPVPLAPEGEPDWRAMLTVEHGRYVELAVLALLTLAVLFFGVRPALRRVLDAVQPAAAAGSTAVVLGVDGRPLLVHGATGATIGVDRAGNPVVVREPVTAEIPVPRLGHEEVERKDGELVDLKHVRGSVQASLLGEVSRAIEANPEDAVRVVRGWLHGS
jgi:flagellar M-ring protein FliF